MQIDKHIIDKINDEHDLVVKSSRDAVQHALNAGQELNRIKEVSKHGEFLAIVRAKFKFSERTAQRYMQIADYSAKTTQLSDLQSAYKLIESEEAKKKQLEQADQRQRIQYRVEHNEKPESWQRADDYAWNKHLEEEQARDERIDDFKRKQTLENEASNRLAEESNQTGQRLIDYLNQLQQKQERLNEIRVSNQNGGILQLIEEYLEQVEGTDKRIEECYNIIKYCKHKAIELHQVVGV